MSTAVTEKERGRMGARYPALREMAHPVCQCAELTRYAQLSQGFHPRCIDSHGFANGVKPRIANYGLPF
jgi:hypothetical protein